MMESKTSTFQSEPTSEIALAPKMMDISGQDMPHREDHKHPGPYMRDIILGFSDGLTVPFALTAGLSSWAFLLSSLWAFQSIAITACYNTD